jgi:hypothetical protein
MDRAKQTDESVERSAPHTQQGTAAMRTGMKSTVSCGCFVGAGGREFSGRVRFAHGNFLWLNVAFSSGDETFVSAIPKLIRDEEDLFVRGP